VQQSDSNSKNSLKKITLKKLVGDDAVNKSKVHGKIRDLVIQAFKLKTMPMYMAAEFTDDGQPLYNRIYDKAFPKVYLEDE
jgi:hypothetical protein